MKIFILLVKIILANFNWQKHLRHFASTTAKVCFSQVVNTLIAILNPFTQTWPLAFTSDEVQNYNNFTKRLKQ